MTLTINTTTTTCPSCGIAFSVPAHYLDEKVAEAGSIYCPNGHRSTWEETERDKLRKRLEREQRATEIARQERNEAQRSEQAQRAAATRARNEKRKLGERVLHGVCPCCKRTFRQLARHMASKHPDYNAETPTG